eukprot:3337761-Pyramimonas_sp.AAC.1
MRRRSLQLQELYGHGVIPPSLLTILNRSVLAMEHCSSEEADKESVRGDLFQILLPLVLKIQSKPITTRFFLFAPAVWALLLMDMLGLGRDLFPEQKGRLRTQGANRIKAMRAFFCHPQTSSDLRKASLCLQLSHHAVSMASQSKPK